MSYYVEWIHSIRQHGCQWEVISKMKSKIVDSPAAKELRLENVNEFPYSLHFVSHST